MKLSNAPRTRLAAVLLSAATTLVVAAPQQQPSDASWTPPPARTKEITLFAPKPLGGDNIFKGEAEGWLADAIEKVEAGSLQAVGDRYVADYVAKLGGHLAAHSVAPKREYKFVVLDDEDANAMSLGGGRVYVNLGMLKEVESEDELACVIAHEIGHDAFGHAPKTVTRQLFWMTGVRKVKTYAETEAALRGLLDAYDKTPAAAVGENLLGFSRFQELEADRAAFYNAYKAGYNPRAMAAIFKRFEREEKERSGDDYAARQFMILLFGSHPPTPQRETALAWESNFVKMPPKTERHRSAAFDAMKARVARL